MNSNDEQIGGRPKRRQYLINPEFQFSFIKFYLISLIFATSLFFLFLNTFFWRLEELGKGLSLPVGHIFYEFVGQQQIFLNSLLGIAGLLAIAMFVVFGVYLTHKVAGPIRKLENYMDATTKENMSPVTFREGDYFQELPQKFNEMIERLK